MAMRRITQPEFRLLTRKLIAVVGALALALSVGCGRWHLANPLASRPSEPTPTNSVTETKVSDAKPAAIKFGDKSGLNSKLSPHADSKSPVGNATELPSDPIKLLKEPSWVLVVFAGDEVVDPQARRWRHPGVEQLMNHQDSAKQLQSAMNSPDEVVAGNAAMAVTYLANPPVAVAAQLVGIVNAQQLRLPMRRAAVESLGYAGRLADIESLLKKYGQSAGPTRHQYQPELHADLLRAYALRGGKNGTMLVPGLNSSAIVVRLAAIDACGKLPIESLPKELFALAIDNQSQVRSAVIRTLVALDHPQAQQAVESGLSDFELTVRVVAIESLGRIGGQANRARLVKLTDDESELVRVTTANAAGRLRDEAILEKSAADKSWRVRLAATAAMESMVSLGSAQRMQKLLVDASVQVQRRVIRTVAAWPLSAAGPVLLLALESRSQSTRRDAAEQFRARWPASVELLANPNATPSLGDLAELRRRWTEFEATEFDANAAADKAPADTIRTVSHDTVNNGQALDKPQFDEDQIKEINSTIERLRAANLPERRAAMQDIIDKSDQRLLHDAALIRIAELIATENDPEIWTDCLTLIAREPREPAQQIAATGASHPSADIRRRACLYFGDHAGELAAEVLLNSLSDRHSAVQRAAVIALGKQTSVPDVVALESLLTAGDRTLRVSVAESLSCLGSRQGPPALVRLTYDQETKIRRLAAAAMGQAAVQMRKRDIEVPRDWPAELQRLMNDRPEVRHAAEESLRAMGAANQARSASE